MNTNILYQLTAAGADVYLWLLANRSMFFFTISCCVNKNRKLPGHVSNCQVCLLLCLNSTTNSETFSKVHRLVASAYALWGQHMLGSNPLWL
eukprot:4694117-Amphidinium_carterae.1